VNFVGSDPSYEEYDGDDLFEWEEEAGGASPARSVGGASVGSLNGRMAGARVKEKDVIEVILMLENGVEQTVEVGPTTTTADLIEGDAHHLYLNELGDIPRNAPLRSRGVVAGSQLHVVRMMSMAEAMSQDLSGAGSDDDDMPADEELGLPPAPAELYVGVSITPAQRARAHARARALALAPILAREAAARAAARAAAFAATDHETKQEVAAPADPVLAVLPPAVLPPASPARAMTEPRSFMIGGELYTKVAFEYHIGEEDICRLKWDTFVDVVLERQDDLDDFDDLVQLWGEYEEEAQ
jgi:hypothetical protein